MLDLTVHHPTSPIVEAKDIVDINNTQNRGLTTPTTSSIVAVGLSSPSRLVVGAAALQRPQRRHSSRVRASAGRRGGVRRLAGGWRAGERACGGASERLD